MSNNNLPKMSDDRIEDVAKIALGMLAVGLSAGFALIAGANKVGHMLLEKAEKKLDDKDDDK